jgi:hypothetical protein
LLIFVCFQLLQANSLSVSWSEPDRVRHSLIERKGVSFRTQVSSLFDLLSIILDLVSRVNLLPFFFFFFSQVEDGSLLYFSTIEDLLSNLKLVPFNSPSHLQLRRQFLTYQSVPAPIEPHTSSTATTNNTSTITSATLVGTMVNPYASSFGSQDTTDFANSTTVPLPAAGGAAKAQPLVFNRDGGVVLQFEPRPLAAPPEAADTTTLLVSSNNASSASNGGANVQDRSPPSAATKSLSAGKKPAITREQAEAAGYSEAPNNLKQLHEKKMAEKFAQKMAAQSGTAAAAPAAAAAAPAPAAASPVSATLAASSLANAAPGTRTSFEIAKLAADDLGSGDLGVSADEDSDSDMSRDFARFNNVPRVDSTLMSSNSVAGSEDLFDSFAARYQTKGASKLGTLSPDEASSALASDNASHRQTLNNDDDDDDSSSSSRDSSLPPYVYQQQKANAPRVAPAILVTNATPLGVTTAAAPPTIAAAPAASAATTSRTPAESIAEVEKLLDQFISGPIEMHDLERLRGSLLQAVRQVNARIDDMLVGGGGGGGGDEPKKSRSKKAGKTAGSSKRKSKKKTED